MSDKHPLDKYFKEGLEEHNIKPSEAVWEKIQAAQPQPSGRKGGWYIMRAAVVVLLLGLSTVFYYQNRKPADNWANTPIEENMTDPDKKSNDKEQNKGQNDEANSKEKSSESKEDVKPKPKKKTVPIMRQSTGRQIYVAKDETLTPFNEEALMDDRTELALEEVALKEKTVSKPAPIKVKFKVAPKAATEGFYANNDKPTEKKEDFKDKVYAYASNQFDNIKNGRPVELPRPDKKPQLEIDLGRIFNN